MSKYQLISDYKHIRKYKESFNDLSKQVFKLDFKKWYDKGFWNDNYICYSFVDGDKIVANASINKMFLVANGKEYKAIQVGTVMTHLDYRHQGLAAKLIQKIIDKYDNEYDFIYLFANETVLDFYPKFGFEQVKESRFSLKTSDLEKQIDNHSSSLRKLDVNNKDDIELMKRFAVERIPVSSKLGVKNNEHLLMFYFILIFNDATYYIEEDESIIIYEHDDNKLHIFDIISKKRVDLDKIINQIVSPDTEVINFHFTPDSNSKNIHTEFITGSNDTLFVRPLLNNEGRHFLFPCTSHS
jgi:GNAT superfamily N-acetyltransferase